SRRRHTRFSRDWSSDVCSSDLQLLARGGQRFRVLETRVGANQLVTATVTVLPPDREDDAVDPLCGEILKAVIDRIGAERFPGPEIGRASCRKECRSRRRAWPAD